MRVAELPGSVSREVIGERLNIAPSGKRFRCDFLEPGFVNYADVGAGVELVRKNTICACMATLVGQPLIVGHIGVGAPVPAGKVHGRIDHVGYDERTNWAFCEGTIDTDRARDLIRAGWKPSVGMRVLATGPGGKDHNIAYTQELTRLNFHHLAIVENPRYQGADIRLNKNQEKPAMSVIKWIKKVLRPATEAGGAATTVEETGELPVDTTLEIDGKPVRMNELVEAHKEKAAAEAARENAIGADDQVEIDGKPVKVSELVATYQARKNAAPEGEKEETDEEKKERETRENAVKAAATRKAAEETARANGLKSFKVIQGARASTPTPVLARANSAGTVKEQIARGASRYGSGKN